MHIPDGFISPKIYLPAYGVAAGLWMYGLSRVRKKLDEETIPLVAVLTALSFILMMVLIPLPGGTSAHAMGVGVLAVMFGIWVSFTSISLVLLIQALLFGDGGITSFPVNALTMGFAGSVSAYYIFRLLRRLQLRAALFAAGWLSVNISALLTAVVLGIQPAIAHSSQGMPLFFPFGLSITLPAVMIPHLLIGIGEGVLTVLIFQFFNKLKRVPDQ